MIDCIESYWQTEKANVMTALGGIMDTPDDASFFFNREHWNEPHPLPEDPSISPWPERVFPEPFEAFIRELERSVEVPIELPAMQLLSVAATCGQAKYQVKIKEDYTEPLSFWSLSILPPASRKSKVFSEITSPLRLWEQKERSKVEQERKSAKSREETLKALIKAKRSVKTKVTERDFNEIQKEIEELESRFPEVPLLPQLWTTDITPECLGERMKENKGVMSILSDESAVFDVLAGLYSDGKVNLDLFLQGHSGGPARVDRNNRGQIDLPRTRLTIGITAQPEVLHQVCKNRTFKGRGLLGRFRYIYPESNIGKRILDVPPMKQEVKTAYHQAIQDMLVCYRSSTDELEQPLDLGLSNEAYDRWLKHAQTNEKLMGEEIGYLSHITDWAGKLAGDTARIAGLLHIMRFRGQDPSKILISDVDMHSATKVSHCLVSHALKVFNMRDLDTPEQKAKSIFSWIRRERKQCFTSREFLRANRGFDKKALEAGILILVEEEYVKKQTVKQEKGRPKDTYFVNPYIWDEMDKKDKTILLSALSQMSP